MTKQKIEKTDNKKFSQQIKRKQFTLSTPKTNNSGERIKPVPTTGKSKNPNLNEK